MNGVKGLTADFFANNRRRLRGSFSGEAMIVLTANGKMEMGFDRTYPFVQDSNFWYVSGLQDPELVLIIDGEKEFIILPERTRANVVFDGPINIDSAGQASGVSKVYDYEKGWNLLKRKIKKAKFIATISPPPIYDTHNNSFTNPAKRQLASTIIGINENIQFVDISANFTNLRLIKQPAEIDAMKTAAKTTVKIYKQLHSKLSKYSRESDIDKDLKAYLLKHQIEMSYDPIIAGGSNANILHYQGDGDGKVDDIVLLDIGARASGYASDVTRTYFNTNDQRYMKIHKALLSIYDYACSLVMPGMTFAVIEQRTRQLMGEKLRELGLIDIISPEEIGRFFPHALGHFVGLDVHDARKYDEPLAAGMVITIEPGIYIKDEGIGMRHEDTLLITKDGYQNLTKEAPTIGRSSKGGA